MSPVVVACMVIASLAGLWGHAFANLGGVEAGSLELTDMDGTSLALVKPGSQFIMSVRVANIGDALSEYAAVQVRDSAGITRWLVTGSGLLGQGQSTRVSTVLPLDEPGRYTFRAFVVDSFERPLAFSPVASASASVIDYPGVYVPLYDYPDLWNPDGVWNSLFRAKQAHPSVPFAITVNPASGPGERQNPAHVHAISELQKSGVEYILGYVPTNYAQQTPTGPLTT